MDNLQQNIEVLIFASENSISIDEILKICSTHYGHSIDAMDIKDTLENIKQKYYADEFIVELSELSGGYQFLTKKKFAPIVNQLQQHRSKKKLTQAALETLAIIAYRQPITKLEIEQLRGVNCDYSVQKLLERELISVVGKSDSIGHPILYATSSLFSDYFGINNIADLPKIDEINPEENAIGNAQ